MRARGRRPFAEGPSISLGIPKPVVGTAPRGVLPTTDALEAEIPRAARTKAQRSEALGASMGSDADACAEALVRAAVLSSGAVPGAEALHAGLFADPDTRADALGSRARANAIAGAALTASVARVVLAAAMARGEAVDPADHHSVLRGSAGSGSPVTASPPSSSLASAPASLASTLPSSAPASCAPPSSGPASSTATTPASAIARSLPAPASAKAPASSALPASGGRTPLASISGQKLR